MECDLDEETWQKVYTDQKGKFISSFVNPNYQLDPTTPIDLHAKYSFSKEGLYEELHSLKFEGKNFCHYDHEDYSSEEMLAKSNSFSQSTSTDSFTQCSQEDSYEKCFELYEALTDSFSRNPSAIHSAEESENLHSREKLIEATNIESEVPDTKSPAFQSIDVSENLPEGWEKHEDADGPYFWHIKSGTVQREKPTSEFQISWRSVRNEVKMPLPQSLLDENMYRIDNVEEGTKEALNKRWSVASFPVSNVANIEDPEENNIRYMVRSLGWLEIDEQCLTAERGSKAVNQCIFELSSKLKDSANDEEQKKENYLYLDFERNCLKLLDANTLTVLNVQSIHTIRIWGVGRDNNRDFAYVAKDRQSQQYRCHAFRCECSARLIANHLRDICQRIVLERNFIPKRLTRSKSTGIGFCSSKSSHFPLLRTTGQEYLFPTPMEEPRKMLRAKYVGRTQVSYPTGIHILNEAITKLCADAQSDKWLNVNVFIAPSTINVMETVVECRVRYLSFLGIAKNSAFCAFIMHTAQDEYVAHVFYCEPSSGAMCTTIEAACKLRYQKCLDAHGPHQNTKRRSRHNISDTIRSLVSSLTNYRMKKSGC